MSGNWGMLRDQPIVVYWPENHFYPPEVGSYVVFPSTDHGEDLMQFPKLEEPAHENT